ncbi:MAG TPA: PAS domain-containing sensor histidine kinase [Conexibacter sp.]|nr:PAS domain-containing sensor histidine kinase [Conexibacter sp.]
MAEVDDASAHVETTGMRADGSEFPVELAITRVRVPGMSRFTAYLRDITDRKRSEAELRRSRARLVEAAYTERQRIERDLHDGTQQRLVSVALGLRLGRARLETDPDAALQLIDEAIDELAEATVELRELARGIHPAVLTQGGLQPALAALVERARTPARLVEAPGERLSAAVESAAYFVVAEALTNVDRYAEATSAEVRAVRQGDRLVVEVADDGRGGADAAEGTGLRGLADRVGALDGTLAVDSPRGGGTALRVEISCAS